MAAVALDLIDRRETRRLPGGGPRFSANAVLFPGQAVVVVNISSRAALIESGARLRPGASTELQLCSGAARACVRGRVARCQVVGLDPLRYHGVLVFDERVNVGDGATGSE